MEPARSTGIPPGRPPAAVPDRERGADRAVQPRMDGLVCLVTGATGGMGKVVAAELARRGAAVVLVARDRAKGEAARQEIAAATGNPAVELAVADLAEFADVRRLAAEVRDRHPALHVLVNNAGAFSTAHRLNADGVEANLAVNFFSPFLLTDLLAEALVAGSPSRVVNVGSAAMAAALDPGGLGPGRRPVGRRGYAAAKLALLVWTFALAKRLDGSGVTANALHPGLAATGIGTAGLPRPLRPLYGVAAAAAVRLGLVASPEQGARTTLHLATAPGLAAVSGRYFVAGREHPAPAAASDPALQERLWRLGERLVGLPPGTAPGAPAAAGGAATPAGSLSPSPARGRHAGDGFAVARR